MDDSSDLTALNPSELIEKVISLQQKFTELKQGRESDAQRIYELTRQLETSNAAQKYLIQELESESRNVSNNDGLVASKKMKAELEDWKSKYYDLKTDFETLQAVEESHVKQLSELEKKLKESSQFSISEESKIENKELINRLQLLEEEYMILFQKMDVLERKNMDDICALGAKEGEIECLKNHVICLEENLRSKKEELEEKIQILESTQDLLSDANSKIALMSAASDEKTNPKGNSLFAEVDDQRQAMKMLLNAQKKSYLEMKHKYLESDHEIRKLKRENNAIRTELTTCARMFNKANQDFHANLMARMKCLKKENEKLEKQLKLTKESLKENAGKNMIWLDSMLNFCREETDDLKTEVRRLRMDKAYLEGEFRNLQQESARCRFESLRLRLSIAEYENMLSENNIKFEPTNMVQLSKKLSQMPEKEKNDLEAKQMFTLNQHQLSDENHSAAVEASKHQGIKASAEVAENTNIGKQNIAEEDLETEEKHSTVEIQPLLHIPESEHSESNILVAPKNLSESQNNNHISSENISPISLERIDSIRELPAQQHSNKKVLSILKNSENNTFSYPTKKVHFQSPNKECKENLRNQDDMLCDSSPIISDDDKNKSKTYQAQQKRNIVVRRMVVKSAQEHNSSNI